MLVSYVSYSQSGAKLFQSAYVARLPDQARELIVPGFSKSVDQMVSNKASSPCNEDFFTFSLLLSHIQVAMGSQGFRHFRLLYILSHYFIILFLGYSRSTRGQQSEH